MNNHLKPKHGLRSMAGLLVLSTLLASCTTDSGNPSEAAGLSGRVVSTNNAPVAGVVVGLSLNGAKDTTDNMGRYNIRPESEQGGSLQDTIVFTKNGQSLARVTVSSWIETLPDVQVVQRDISGLLLGSGTTISRIEGIVTGDGIDSVAPVTSDFYYNPLTGNYSGFVYFPMATTVQNYQVQVKVYGPGDILVGNSVVVPFSSYAGNITVPSFGTGNARPVAHAGVDTAVVPNGSIHLSGSAVDSGGSIVLWEWSIGGSPFVAVSMGDTSFSRATQGAYPCILRVTDNDGNQAVDTMVAAVLSQGVNWTTRTSGTTAALTGVVWAGTQFVAVGNNGTVVTSPDGITWTAGNVGANVPLTSVAWSGEKIVVGSSGGPSQNGVFVSSNGTSWTTSTLTGAGVMGPLAVSSADTAIFVAAQSNTNSQFFKSVDDGTTWTVSTFPSESTGLISSVWNFTLHAGRYIGVGGNGAAGSSLTGEGTWTRHTTSTTWPRPAGGVYDYTMTGIVSTGTHAVAVGYAGHVMRSTDGVTWQQPRVAGIIPEQAGGSSTGDFYGVAWTGNALVAVGNGYHMVSADGGVNWARVETGATNLSSVAWNGTRLVAVGAGGAIVTSN